MRVHVGPGGEAGREKGGKTMDGFEIVAAIPVCLTTDRAAGRAVFRQTVERYANPALYYRKMMDASGFAAELEAGEISDAMLDELSGIGGEEQVREVISRYREAGVTLPCAGPFGGHQGAAGFQATLHAAARG